MVAHPRDEHLLLEKLSRHNYRFQLGATTVQFTTDSKVNVINGDDLLPVIYGCQPDRFNRDIYLQVFYFA